MNPFGLNVLAQPGIDRAALLKYVDRAKPVMMVVMDDTALAQQIRAASPKTLVVHRTYHQADSRWHEVVTPKEFLDAHKPTAVNGVVCAVYNEPSGAGLFAASTWIEQLIAQCPIDMTLALPHMAVGNPSEDEILAGKFDRILKSICGSRHYLALHEYFVTDPLAETPYYCGRFTFWQRRARQLGLPAPKIIITEHGRDVGGGVKDGWRDTGWSEDQYFARLVQARELYKPHGIPVAVYCYGAGFSQRWQSFNIEGATTLLDKMAEYEETMPTTPDIPAPTDGGVKATLTKIPKDFINVRQQPNGNDAGDLLVGDVVTYYPDAPVVAGGAQWVYQTPLEPIERPTGRQNAALGWVSLQDGGVVFEKVIDPPVEPPTEETVKLKVSEVDAMIAANEQALAILRGAKLPGDGTKMLLDMPYVSQLGKDADSHNNDCLVADLLMCDRFLKKAKTGVEPDLPTVDMIVPATPLAGNPSALLTFNDGIALAKRLGFKVAYQSGMKPDAIRKSLDIGAPVIALVDYAKYNPAGKPIPHFMVISGYDGDAFITQDSYLMGANVKIEADTLDKAMKAVPGNTGEYQALTLAA